MGQMSLEPTWNQSYWIFMQLHPHWWKCSAAKGLTHLGTQLVMCGTHGILAPGQKSRPSGSSLAEMLGRLLVLETRDRSSSPGCHVSATISLILGFLVYKTDNNPFSGIFENYRR